MANSKNKRGKSSKKETLNQPAISEENENNGGGDVALKSDLLDDFLFNAANYIYVRRKIFIALSIAAIIILVTGWGIFKYIAYQNNQRNEQLYQIEQIIYNTDLSDDQKIKQAIPLLNSFVAEHPDTTQFNTALFYRAGLNSGQKNFTEAESDLNQLRSKLDSGSDLYFLASLYLSNVLRDQNKIDEAFEVLQSAKTEAVTDIILMEQAEMYMNSNQEEKSRELLQILLKDYPKSFYANKARQLLDIL